MRWLELSTMGRRDGAATYRWTLVLLGAVGLAGLQGCDADGTPIPDGPAVVQALTAQADAPPVEATMAPPATEPSAQDTAIAPEATGQLATPLDPDLGTNLDGLPLPPEAQMAGQDQVSEDPEGTAIAQRSTAEAELGVANVNELVMKMPRLATFTPDARSASKGSLVYVRGGALYQVEVGGKPAKVQHDQAIPALWAPPQDPGRAWMAPDGQKMAVMAGSDAELWVTGPDGKGTRPISGPNLPSDARNVIIAGGGTQVVKFKPGTNYTLVHAEGGERPLAVLADDINEERRGNGRIRFVHAASGQKDAELQVKVNDAPFGGPMKFGRPSGELRVPAGPFKAEVFAGGKVVATFEALEVQSKEIKTFFLIGAGDLQVQGLVYPSGQTPGNAAQVRVFNASAKPISVTADTTAKLATDVAPGTAGPYVRVPSLLTTEERKGVELAIYGLRTRQYALSWAPESDRVAFLGAGDGTLDLYVSDLKGEAKALTSDPADQLNPVWSPDGDRLAWYTSEVNVILYSVQVANADGSGVTTVDLGPIRQAAGLAPTEKLFFPQDLIWVDDATLALLPRADSVQGSIGMFLVNVETGRARPLTRDPVFAVDWSPQEKAFVFTPDKETGTVIRMGLDGRAKTLAEGQAFFPEWSPEGDRISYIQGGPTDGQGWVLHVMKADGSGDRAVSPRWPLVQEEPPVPGPRAKRFWLDGGKTLLFSRVGQDYGAADRAGMGRLQTAGMDIENLFATSVEGSSPTPRQLTDLTQVFYLDDVEASPDGQSLGFIGLWYQSRTQQLWVAPAKGGKPLQIDGPVRWFAWTR